MWQKHTNMMGWSHKYTKVTNELTCASNLTDVWCIYNFVVNLLHEATHEPTANFPWDANCTKKTWTYIGIDVNVSHQPDKLPKKPTVRHKDVISSVKKRSHKQSLVLTHPVGISPRDFPPVLCSPASRPKKRPFNTKPLGDKHCLQRLALKRFAGDPKWAKTPDVSQNWWP